jgi:hypothetical protein
MIHKEYRHFGEQDRYEPHVVCDSCQVVIERAEEGNFLFPLYEKTGTQQIVINGPIVFVHKGSCDEAYIAAHPEYQWSSDELQNFPSELGVNLGLD